MPESCYICGNADSNRVHKAREMMFGTREEFDYLECSRCGTLQRQTEIDDKRFYPQDYYSLIGTPVLDIERGWRQRLAAAIIGRRLLGKPAPFGAVISRRRPWLDAQFPNYLRELGGRLDFDSRILDVGCGAGELLRTLRVFGFRNLTGADKYISGDLTFSNIRIYKRGLDELTGLYDLIMLNHSFEHLANPHESLKSIGALLSENGLCIIRIPVVNFAWETYGINWVQLDAPRHIFLYTERAFRHLAAASGFRVERVVYDSDAFQFYASEQYARDIPMNDKRSYRGVISESIFEQSQIDDWTKLAAELNARSRGDQAVFYLSAA